jgi:tetraacyldisaccharide 4'-kinase
VPAASPPAALLQRHWWRRPPSALAWLLLPLAAIYATLAAAHRRWTAAGAQRLAVPVIVVGNLVAGGAGKTPTVIALLRWLREQGYTPGVVSRGHGRDSRGLLEVGAGSRAAEVGDEPLLIHRRSGAPVVVAADRVAAGQHLLALHPQVDIVVGDDGLQHHRLWHDLALVVFDERGVGNGLRLPAGPLRAALPAAVPPHWRVLYNAAAPTTALPGATLRRRLAGAVALRDWWLGAPASPAKLEALRGRRVVAAAGIAAPERFFTMLEAEGLTIDRLPLPDHHDFAALPWPPSTADVVLTEKDAVKVAPERAGVTRVWVVPLDLAFDAAFEAQLRVDLQALRREPR